MSSNIMAVNEEPPLDALAISQLGKAFSDRLKDERTRMEGTLAEREGALARLESTIAAALSEAGDRANASAEAIAALRADRDVAAAALLAAGQREKEALDAVQALGAERDAAVQKLAAEATRLKLVHQGQVEALFARHREAEASLQSALAETRTHVTELEAQRDEAQRELAALREQLRALAQEAAEARFARGEAEAALQTQREKYAALDASARAAEAEARSAIDRERQQSAELAEAFRVARGEAELRISEAREAVTRAEERVVALTRNARAREAMLQEVAQEASLQGQLDAMREKARGDRLTSRAAALALVLRKSGRRDSAVDAVLEGLGGDADGLRGTAQSVDEAVHWLALHAGPAMASGNDVGFEVTAASLWTDDTWIAAAYRWLLGRPVDKAGRAHYAQKLSGSMTRRDLLVDLACSAEARSRLTEASAARGAEDRRFVMAAYDSLLDRGPDTGGLDHYLARIEAGISRANILLDLARSAEAREAATPVGTSLLAIWQAGLPRSRLRKRVERLLLRRLPRWYHAWQAGRMAALHCEMDLAQEATSLQLSEIGCLADQRVAAARETALAGAPGAASEMAAAFGVASAVSTSAPGSAPAAFPAATLGETSAQRSTDQIVSLIRHEIKELGL